MRVVVDFSPQQFLPRGRAVAPGEGEQVTVIRRGPEGREGLERPGGPERPQAASDGEYRTSDEARRLDSSVRAHERLHQLALGPYADSGVQLTTRRGADGEEIAVGGRIKADLEPVPGDPRATLRKANAVRQAALAPGSPSAADLRVANEAYRLAQHAREELSGRYLDTSV